MNQKITFESDNGNCVNIEEAQNNCVNIIISNDKNEMSANVNINDLRLALRKLKLK